VNVLIAIVLVLLVACCWIAAAALLRLPRGMDRLHAVSFAPLAASPLLLIVTGLQTGMSLGTAKVAFLWLVNALVSIGVAHALGRLMRPSKGGEA
jgi:multisubunit Na+/H+ antiporter MnhG subunit